MPSLSWLFVSALAAAVPAGEAARPPSFNRDIRPILSEKCYTCHGPDRAKRKAGLRLDRRESAEEKDVLSPGDVEESELVRRILSGEEDERMPPPSARKQLDQRERDLLVEWIAQGALYEEHWAYAPLLRPELPRLEGLAPANPIDAFVAARLAERGVEPSPRADPRTLYRRLSLDLIGLPPSPEELEAFLADERPDSWSRAVERLLASPHYGERMAGWWLDVARYADTVGYHGDQNVNVFPYRDWVIEAFQGNMAFDRFTLEQLAGDLLPDKSQSALVATAFLRLNMVTREGGAQPKEYLAKYAADRVRTVAATWLGSTMGCAECHDHKYDPFTTRDFYALEAFFADITQWGVYQDYAYTPNPDLAGWSNDHPFPPEIEVESPALMARLARLEERIEGLRGELAERLAREGEERTRYAEWRAEAERYTSAQPDGWSVLAPVLVPASEERPEKIVRASAEADGSLLLEGGLGEIVTLRMPLPAGGLASIRLDLLPDERHGGTIVRGGGERTWVSFGAKLLPAAGGEAQPLAIHHAEATRADPRYGNGYEVIGVRSGWLTATAHAREPQSAVYQLDEPRGAAEGDQLEISLAHGSVGRLRLAVSPYQVEDPRELDLAPALGTERSLDTYLHSGGAPAELVRELRRLEREKRECRGGKGRVVVCVAREPEVTRVLPRGNWQDESGEVVEPALPAFLRREAAPERRLTRLDLARWLVSPENPLTARTLANRLWKLFFGNALSAVVDDLGSQGEWPVQQELLDWLACELRDSGWDLGHIVRLIVESETYRRASDARADLAELDPDDHLLARQIPRRLEAELVRDQALFVAGLLNEEVGGPSSHPYQPPGYYANLQFPDRDYRAELDERQYRRGLYSHWQRTFLHPMLANFDAPSREECTAARVVSSTPQQALTLLNDPTFVEAARALAERLLEEEHSDDGERLARAFALVLQRAPRTEEAERLLRFLGERRARYAAAPAEAVALVAVGQGPRGQHEPVELAAWTSVARVLGNSHETITRY